MNKLLFYLFITLIITSFTSCAGVHFSSGIGIGISGGPYGPHITPNVNIGIYSGGYR